MSTDPPLDVDPSPRSIADVAADLGLDETDIEPYGTGVAKVTPHVIERAHQHETPGSLVLVTGITPTSKGEGKTVTSIGLAQGLARNGHQAAVAIREPSLGPVFGLKGGATGGGHSQVIPADRINLHFTGDMHAITSAHNLIAAVVDAHIHHDNTPSIDPGSVSWPRAIDMNDRTLRETVVGLGGQANGPVREDGFVITPASELMATICMAADFDDLRTRISHIVVAKSTDGSPVTVGDLEVTGAVLATLADAFRPNLVQTTEGVPAFVHGGPFANIAHGTNSSVADIVGLTTADVLVTEAGFGADLGAEKFFNIVARHRGIVPDAVVIVASVRGLKRHGIGADAGAHHHLEEPNPDAVSAGMENLAAHVRIIEQFGLEPVVAINRFQDDTPEELDTITAALERNGVDCAVSTAYTDGGSGASELANLVEAAIDTSPSVAFTYEDEDSIREKIDAVATDVYGADRVEYEARASQAIESLTDRGYDHLPICVAKTPFAFLEGGHTLEVRDVTLSAGAGFLVVHAGSTLLMPGLPKSPAAKRIDRTIDGSIQGLE